MAFSRGGFLLNVPIKPKPATSPSSQRSALVQALMLQGLRNQGRPSRSVAESLDIAAPNILAALLAKREQAATQAQAQQQRSALAQALGVPQPNNISISSIPGAPRGQGQGQTFSVPPMLNDQQKATGDLVQSLSPENVQGLQGLLLQSQIQKKFGTAKSLIGLADPSDFTPESLGKYSQSGNAADLVPISKTAGRYYPQYYTPESWAQFVKIGDPAVLVRQINYQPQTTPGGGILPFNPLTGKAETPVITAEQGTEEAAKRAQATSQASATGEAAGKVQGAILARAANAGGIKDVLDIADPLIDEATGSGTGAARDKLAAFFGESTTGAQAIAQLLPLQAAIMMRQPRMEGPQSDRDVQLYREAAGQIGDPTVPRETKKAALVTIRKLQDKYSEEGKGSSSSAPKRIRVDAEGNVIP